jgi:branched-chain amino acid transport system ATP-binding protein
MSVNGPGTAPTGGTALADGTPPALDVDHVSASYGPYRALFDVSFAVPAAGITALLGSNGAGKSTVARVVTGLLPSTEGTIRLAGRDVTGLAAYKIARAGSAHVPEGRGVFANLTVEENLRLAFRQRGGRKSVSGSLERAFAAFPVLGARRKQHGGTLSGGEQRILSLAKVLVEPPRVLVADEISLGLAPVMIDAVYEGLVKINQAGTALLIVEQQVDRVLDIAAAAVILEHGSVAYAGPTDGALSAMESVLASRGDRALLPTERSPDGANLGWATGRESQTLRFRRRNRTAKDDRQSLPPPPTASAEPTAPQREEPE